MLSIKSMYDKQGGMFSKAGRHTSEKYMVFQKKDEIIGGKRKLLKLGSAPSIEQPKPEVQVKPTKEQTIMDEEKLKDTNMKNKKKDEESQPFFKQTSREQIQLSKQERFPAPPTGYYHPKFNGLDKSPHNVWDILKVQSNLTRSKKSLQILGDSQEEMKRPIPERPQSYVKGNVSMGTHSIRDDRAMKDTIDPHEGRFNYLNLNLTFSKIPRIPSADISKQLGRYNAAIYKLQNYAPDYDPDYAINKPRLDIGQTPFQKSLPRKGMEKRPQTTNENYFNYDYYYKRSESNLFVMPKGVRIDKQQSREGDPQSSLPSFMQKGLNSRMMLKAVNQKMLETNNYMEGRFQTISSSFSKKRLDISTKKRRNFNKNKDADNVSNYDRDNQNI